jgi:hypothetical protein
VFKVQNKLATAQKLREKDIYGDGVKRNEKFPINIFLPCAPWEFQIIVLLLMIF